MHSDAVDEDDAGNAGLCDTGPDADGDAIDFGGGVGRFDLKFHGVVS